jgi:hypothetical protein
MSLCQVWNDTELSRLTLIVDIWHPEFSEKECQFLTSVLTNGDKQSIERGDNLIKNVMDAHADHFNSTIFTDIPTA